MNAAAFVPTQATTRYNHLASPVRQHNYPHHAHHLTTPPQQQQHQQQHSPSSIYSTHPATPPLATPYTISSPVGAPFYPKPEDYGGYQFAQAPQRLSASMPLEILPRAHWLSRVRSCLRLLIIVLSGAVVFMLMHTLGIYRGNRYLELRKGEIPMVWPAHTNLAPTIVLTAIAGLNFLASVAILALSFKRSFHRPLRSRDLYRVIAGSVGVVLWAAALAVFHLLDNASKASLGRYSCTNQAQMTNGRYQYRAVCEEQVRASRPFPPQHPPHLNPVQSSPVHKTNLLSSPQQNVAFYTAIAAGAAELLTLLTLAATTIRSIRDEPALPTIQIHEKKDSNHLSSAGWKPTRPKTWIQ